MPDWIEELTPDDREQWNAFVEHTRRETLHGMIDSAFVVSLVPKKDDIDIKFCVELGMAIMLEKPIMAVVMPGAEVPTKLRAAVDEIVFADIDVEEGRRQVAEAIERMAS